MYFTPRFGAPRLILAALFVLLVGQPVSAAENRFWLASQQDFGGKRGFYLAFENSSSGEQSARLSTLRLILGVGDGKNWRFPSITPDWKFNHEYTVTAVVGASSSQLRLDDLPPLDSPGAFSPATETLLSNHVPEWAAGAADYRIVQTSLRLQASGGKHLALTFPGPAQLPEPMRLFERRSPSHREELALASGETLTLRATFQIVPAPATSAEALQQFAPLVDRYGQAVAAQWPDKVRSDADLKSSIAEEARRYRQWGTPAGRDRFGGDTRAGWRVPATGFYQTVRRGKFWWLVSPEGSPCFYTGLCTAPAPAWEKTPVTGRENIFADLPSHEAPYDAAWGGNPWGGSGAKDWVALRTANLIRKYGPDWKARSAHSLPQRLRAWAFSGLGKWCDFTPGTPSVPVLSAGDVPKIGRHADIFDPAVRAQFRASLEKQITPHKADPDVVGWSFGNEYDEIVTPGEIAEILQKSADSPAKRALIDEGLGGNASAGLAAAWKTTAPGAPALYTASLTGTPPEDLERLRRFYADLYYDFLYRTVKEIDPHHLYLGFWIVPNWWVSEEDWRLIARHCDVIGYDNYAYQFATPMLRRLMDEADKPVLCGEFSFPPDYLGTRGFGVYSVWADDEAQAGRLYADWVKGAATDPHCVGVCWFQYRDEPLTGRGPGGGPDLVYGEHYAFGLVDESDRPKWPLVERVRQANLATIPDRLKAAGERGVPASSRSAPPPRRTAIPHPSSSAARRGETTAGRPGGPGSMSGPRAATARPVHRRGASRAGASAGTP